MKKIETVICPHNWDAVREVLGTLGVTATLREVKTFGRVPPKSGVYRGSLYTIETSPELELTILVPDERLESFVSALSRVIGNAEIVATPVEYWARGGDRPRGREAAVPQVIPSRRPIASPASWPQQYAPNAGRGSVPTL